MQHSAPCAVIVLVALISGCATATPASDDSGLFDTYQIVYGPGGTPDRPGRIVRRRPRRPTGHDWHRPLRRAEPAPLRLRRVRLDADARNRPPAGPLLCRRRHDRRSGPLGRVSRRRSAVAGSDHRLGTSDRRVHDQLQRVGRRRRAGTRRGPRPERRWPGRLPGTGPRRVLGRAAVPGRLVRESAEAWTGGAVSRRQRLWRRENLRPSRRHRAEHALVLEPGAPVGFRPRRPRRPRVLERGSLPCLSAGSIRDLPRIAGHIHDGCDIRFRWRLRIGVPIRRCGRTRPAPRPRGAKGTPDPARRARSERGRRRRSRDPLACRAQPVAAARPLRGPLRPADRRRYDVLGRSRHCRGRTGQVRRPAALGLRRAVLHRLRRRRRHGHGDGGRQHELGRHAARHGRQLHRHGTLPLPPAGWPLPREA